MDSGIHFSNNSAQKYKVKITENQQLTAKASRSIGESLFKFFPSLANVFHCLIKLSIKISEYQKRRTISVTCENLSKIYGKNYL